MIPNFEFLTNYDSKSIFKNCLSENHVQKACFGFNPCKFLNFEPCFVSVAVPEPFISVQMTLTGRKQYSISTDLLTNKLEGTVENIERKWTYKRISQKFEMNGTEGFEVESSSYWQGS